MDKFWYFFHLACREGQACPIGLNGRKVCIQLYCRQECVHDCSRLHAPLHGQIRADYTRLMYHCRAGHKSNTYTQKQRSGVGVWDLNWTGGNITEAEEMDTSMAGSGATLESKVAVPKTMATITAGTGVHPGDKGIHITPPTPNTDIVSSAVDIPTLTEVGRDECCSQGNGWEGHDRKKRGDGTEYGVKKSFTNRFWSNENSRGQWLSK